MGQGQYTDGRKRKEGREGLWEETGACLGILCVTIWVQGGRKEGGRERRGKEGRKSVFMSCFGGGERQCVTGRGVEKERVTGEGRESSEN